MSIADMVNEEEARVLAEEAESDDGESGDEPADDVQTPEAIEQGLRRLDQERRRYLRAAERIMGGAYAELHDCPQCTGSPVLGRVFVLPPAEPEYQPDPTSETCPTCLGLGDVATGAVVERGRLKPCPRCTGYGYVSRQQSQTQTWPSIGGVQLPAPPMPAGSSDGRDPWGRQTGHPQWGVDPDSVGR